MKLVILLAAIFSVAATNKPIHIEIVRSKPFDIAGWMYTGTNKPVLPPNWAHCNGDFMTNGALKGSRTPKMTDTTNVIWAIRTY